jgi:5-methylthioadenosine/S-adenosylhomocysteine deaminase
MKILFKKIVLMDENGCVNTDMYLAVKDNKISYIGKTAPTEDFDRVIDGTDKLLCPGFYNCHTHTPMTLFRGYAENLPLSRWLH